jgi:hypothetical protein
MHALYVPAVAIVLAIFLADPGFHYSKASLHGMVYGQADRPFVYRVLVPTMVRFLTQLVPDSARDRFVAATRPTVFARMGRQIGVDPRDMVELVIATVLLFAALYAFVLTLRWLFSRLYRHGGRFADVVPLLALLLLPMFFCWASYLYDFPELLFFNLSFALMLQRRWGAYLAIFVLACLNKETQLFATFIFAIYFRRDFRKPAYWALLVTQGVIFLTIKLAVNAAFRGNPGSMMEMHLLRNLTIVLKGPWPVSTVAGLLVLVLLLSYRFSENPRFLKDGLWVFVPVFGLTLVFGQVDEIRNYYGAFPVVMLLLARGFGGLIGCDIRAVEEQSSLSVVEAEGVPIAPKEAAG